MEKTIFDFEPGKKRNIRKYENYNPVFSVIVPFYNDKEYITQSINSILNQTFPHFEILIIDDGSQDKESLDILENIEKSDSRIHVFHKQNEGLAATRDYGVCKATECTKYLVFLDSDDLISETYLECAFWTLECNPDAGWAYSNTLGFDLYNYKWNKPFNSVKLMKQNSLVATSVVRKDVFSLVDGFGLKEKAVNEDWNFWLKLIAKGVFPVHMSFYGQWYRRKQNGELAKANSNKKRTMEIISKTKEGIKDRVEAIEYPKYDYDGKDMEDTLINGKDYKILDVKSVLFFVSKISKDGIMENYLDLIVKLQDKGYTPIIISSEPCIDSVEYLLEGATVYDLSSFLEQKYMLSFINYIIVSKNVLKIVNLGSRFGYSVIPYIKDNHPKISLLDYMFRDITDWNFEYKSSIISSIDQILVKDLELGDRLRKTYGVVPVECPSQDELVEKIVLVQAKSVANGNGDYKRIVKEFFEISSQEIKEKSKEYKDNLYYKKERISIKKLLWNIPIWRVFVTSSFWKENIRKLKR